MKLKLLFKSKKLNKNVAKLEVSGLSNDTRSCKSKDLFFIIERKSFDIFYLIKKSKIKPVAFVVSAKSKKKAMAVSGKIPIVAVKSVDLELKRIADIFYPVKKKDLTIIGVTGTNGKTTVTHLIHYLFNRLGVKSALIGTIAHFIAGRKIKAENTTPGFLFLKKLFSKINSYGIKNIVMEVSSHSIDQKRIEGIRFSQCIFTNLSRDHLDYHKSISNYFRVKKKFFLDNPQAISIINLDNSYG